MSQVWAYLAVTALMFTGLLLIFIILLQRGRGGGLAGAFGGAGGQSALGTKAGDVFTKITVGLAVFWVFLACLSIYALRAGSEGRATFGDSSDSSAPAVANDSEAESEADAGPSGAATPDVTSPDDAETAGDADAAAATSPAESDAAPEETADGASENAAPADANP